VRACVAAVSGGIWRGQVSGFSGRVAESDRRQTCCGMFVITRSAVAVSQPTGLAGIRRSPFSAALEFASCGGGHLELSLLQP